MKVKKLNSKDSYHDESKEDNGEGSALKIKHENMTPELKEEAEKIKLQTLKANQDLHQIKELQNKALRLEGELDNKNKAIERLNGEISNKNDAYHKLKTMYDTIQRENEDLRLEQQNFATTSDEVAQLRFRLNEKNDEIAELMEKNDGLVKEIEEFRQNIHRINQEKAQSSKNFTVEIEQLKDQIKQLQNEKLQIEENSKLASDKELSLEKLEKELKEVAIIN